MARPVKRLRDPADLTSEKLAADVDAWIAKGNAVKVVPSGATSELAHPARKYDKKRKRGAGIDIAQGEAMNDPTPDRPRRRGSLDTGFHVGPALRTKREIPTWQVHHATAGYVRRGVYNGTREECIEMARRLNSGLPLAVALKEQERRYRRWRDRGAA